MEDITRDGCYRCILAYRDSRNMDAISRKAAQALLKKVLEDFSGIADFSEIVVAG